MDVKAYIESGILESLALGQASAQEQQEVACLSKIYPEIAAHLKQVETDLGDYSKQYQVEPPKALKQNILSAITDIKQEGPEDNESNPTKETKAEPKVIPLNQDVSPIKRRPNLALVATLFLTIALAGITFTLSTKSSQKDAEITDLVEANKSQKQTIAEINEQINVLLDPEITLVKMPGTEKYASAFASVYWNSESGHVVLNTKSLDPLPEDKQYQLWVLVDGNPMDMGLVPNILDKNLIDMKTTKTGQHFAITIENKGGSEAPTLEEMVVFGSIPA